MQTHGGVGSGSSGHGVRIWATALAAVIAAGCHGGGAVSDHVRVDAVPCDGTHGSGCSGSALNACDNGVDACGSNEQCIECLRDAACADGPDPVWDGCECVCADTPAHCQLTFCCVVSAHWDPALCTCVANP